MISYGLTHKLDDTPVNQSRSEWGQEDAELEALKVRLRALVSDPLRTVTAGWMGQDLLRSFGDATESKAAS